MSYYYGLGQLDRPVATAVPVSSEDWIQRVEVQLEPVAHRAPAAVPELQEILVRPVSHRAPPATSAYTPPPVMSMTQSGPSSGVMAPGVEMPYKPSAPPPPTPLTPTDPWAACTKIGGNYNYVTGKCDISGVKAPGKTAGVGTVAVVGAAALAALLLVRR